MAEAVLFHGSANICEARSGEKNGLRLRVTNKKRNLHPRPILSIICLRKRRLTVYSLAREMPRKRVQVNDPCRPKSLYD
jgi:hypothetical protein